MQPSLLTRGKLVAQCTAVGWIITGRAPGADTGSGAVACAAATVNVVVPWYEQLTSLLQRFLELEDIPDTRRLSPADAECEALFKEHRRDADGRYIVRLPLKRDGRRLLGQSLPSALALAKLRVVCNASQPTSSGYSLNDVLHPGPKLQSSLPSVLTRWRRHRVAFCTDVQMMFRQIQVDERDVDLQHVVWAPDASHLPAHYALLTVTYGESFSPYLSLRALLQLCEDEGHRWPDAVPVVKHDRYADDILSGADSVVRDQLIRLLKAGCFPLRKWVANAPEFLEDLPEDARLCPTWHQISADGLVSQLGVAWDPETDRLRVNAPSFLNEPVTKRSMLATLARWFDPCGWLSPVSLVAKLLLQDLWRARIDWDEPVPPSMSNRWAAFVSQFSGAPATFVPRWIGRDGPSEFHLHAFSNASRRAMAAVAYSRVEGPDKRLTTCLLAARTKLASIKSLQPAAAPLPRMTIPRLELRAALMAARLLRHLADELRVPLDRCHGWTDSQVVLRWIRSAEPTSNALVNNYVAQIQELLPSHVWKYVPTGSNPADVTSRGTDVAGLHAHRLWWEGPAWLAAHLDTWPAEPFEPPSRPPASARPTSPISCPAQVQSSTVLERFSNLDRLLGLLSRVRRWVRLRLCRLPTPAVLAPLSVSELHESLLACVRLSQGRIFGSELDALRRGGRLAVRHHLAALDIFLHTDGILRVGGRLQHSAVPFEERHPPVLSGSCLLAQLIIAWAHLRALHGGARVSAAYAARRAWIVGGLRKVKAYICHCVVYTRLRARPSAQQMGQLPACRVTPAQAFSRTGVDYAGPFYVLASKGREIRTIKGYVALFVCLGTKALHIELVGDLTADSFLGALSRFSGRRGRPRELWSDNATCFRRADPELREALRAAEIDWGRVEGSLASMGIAWHFIPPGAPHFGGLWEAGVKSVKNHLRRIIGPCHLTFEELSTVLVSFKAVLNSRPLTPLTGDPGDLDVLTPGHCLVGGPLTSVVEPSAQHDDLDHLQHWQLVRQMRALFWSRWSREYLNTLQARSKWAGPCRSLAIDDLVVILDPTLLRPNGAWPLARVVQTYPGPDDLVRAARVRTATSEYVPPVTKLARLPGAAPAADSPDDSEAAPSRDGGPASLYFRLRNEAGGMLVPALPGLQTRFDWAVGRAR